MFRFAQPVYLYALALIPLLALLHYLTDFRRRRRLREFGDPELLKPLMPDVSVWRRELKFWLLTAALGMIIVCLARPQYGTKIDSRTRRGIEAIVALDVSNSMLATDVSPSRLDKAKMLVSSLVDGMTDDKIGLIVYAGDAFTQLPITSDYVSAKMFLDNISPSMINVQGTDIARAIELATHSFTQQEGVGRAIFVITDGEDNEGGAEAAAAEAAKRGMKVYVLGVGSPEGSPIPMPGSNGYITDNAGNTVISKLNEDMCRQISQAGSGAYIYVDNSSSALSALQKHVDKLAKADIESVLYSEFDEHFRDFAWAALILLIIETIILARRNRVLSRFRLFPQAKAAALLALFVLPALIPLIVFWIYPICRSIYLSFTNWDFISPTYKMVGLKNYLSLFRNPRFFEALWHTVVFTAGTLIPTIVLGLILALLLVKSFRGSGILKFIIFSPWITPT